MKLLKRLFLIMRCDKQESFRLSSLGFEIQTENLKGYCNVIDESLQFNNWLQI